MITDIGNFYLYRHVRLDKNEPFYIGIGVKNFKRKDGYCRAYSKSGRTKHWRNIINISQYIVNILLESNDYEFIKKKEIEFIALYGRRDLGKGTLVNMTDGGEGVLGRKYVCSEGTRIKLSIAAKGRVVSQETRTKLSKAFKGRVSPMKGKKQTQRFIDAIKKANTGVPKSEEHKKKVGDAHRGKSLPERTYAWRYKKVDQFNTNGEFIKTWNNIRDASNYYKVGTSEICVTCKANHKDYPSGHKSYNRKTCRGFIWKYNEN